MVGAPLWCSRLRNRSCDGRHLSELHEAANGVGFPTPTRSGASEGVAHRRGDIAREAGTA